MTASLHCTRMRTVRRSSRARAAQGRDVTQRAQWAGECRGRVGLWPACRLGTRRGGVAAAAACALWALESHRRCSRAPLRAASSTRTGTTVENRASRLARRSVAGCVFRDSGEHLPHAPLEIGHASASSCVQRAPDLALPRFRPAATTVLRSRWRPLPRRGISVTTADWRSPQRALRLPSHLHCESEHCEVRPGPGLG